MEEEGLRVIVDGPRDPRMNMAVDEAIARLRSEVGVDTLRIYMWLPGGLSLGRRQKVSEVNLKEATRRGYVLVRRPTGGAALLHPWRWEVTYSVILSPKHPLAALPVEESAAAIARGIVLALEKLGVEAGIGGFRGSNVRSGLCYVRPGSSDVILSGRKVSGSAQLRTPSSLLQHGTLLLKFDPEEWLSIIPVEGHSAQTIAAKVSGLYDIVGEEIPLNRIIEALIEGFVEALGYSEWSKGGLEPPEVELAVRLYIKKYSSYEWNMEGKAETI